MLKNRHERCTRKSTLHLVICFHFKDTASQTTEKMNSGHKEALQWLGTALPLGCGTSERHIKMERSKSKQQELRSPDSLFVVWIKLHWQHKSILTFWYACLTHVFQMSACLQHACERHLVIPYFFGKKSWLRTHLRTFFKFSQTIWLRIEFSSDTVLRFSLWAQVFFLNI